MTDGKSLSPHEIKLKQLQAILPEVFTEGKADWEKLKAALGEDINFSNERYVLNWAGKSDAFKILQAPSSKTLIPAKDESVNFEETGNIFIEGENLEVLKVLQKSCFAKIKMIYIDPPYNTGNDSFIYPDNFSENKEEYRKRVGDTDENGYMTKEGMFRKNSRENGQYHSNWLNMMYPRMFLAKNLLRQDGVIFISIDDNEAHNLRLLMNEVFGEENFIANLAVQLNPRGRHLDKFIAKTHETIMIFAKSSEHPETIYGIEKQGDMIGEYDCEDAKGKYRKLGLRNRNRSFNPMTRPNLYYPLYVNPNNGSVSVSKDASHTDEVLPDTAEGVKTCWTWGAEKVIRENNLLVAEKSGDEWRIYRKDYLLNENGEIATTLLKSVWTDKEINNDYGRKAIKDLFGSSVMDFPKSPDLIKKLIDAGSTAEDIVLDFFAGSATTAHAVMNLNKEDGGNRKFICVQLPETCDEKSEAYKAGYRTIADIAKERIRRVIKQDCTGLYRINKINRIDRIKKEEKAEENYELFGKNKNPANLENPANPVQDSGFKVFKLSESNFKQWRGDLGKDADALKQQIIEFTDPVAPNATVENMVYELLLKSGKDLNSKLEHKENYYCVNNNELVLMLEKAGQDIADAVVRENPQKVIALDRIFEGNDPLKTNTVLQMREAGIEFKSI